MRWLAITLLLISSVSFAADERSRPEWVTTCQIGGTTFQLQFESISGDASEDDQVVYLSWGAGNPVALPIKPGLFVPVEFQTDAKNHCKHVGAFEWPGDKLLLLIAQDDRPSEDRIKAVVIDSHTGVFIEDGGDVGPVHDFVLLLKNKLGYRISVLRTWHQDANDFGEFAAADWLRIFSDSGYVRYNWETENR